MDKEQRPNEEERVRKIIRDAYRMQTKRTIKVIFYFFVIFFAIRGGMVVYRWIF